MQGVVERCQQQSPILPSAPESIHCAKLVLMGSWYYLDTEL